MFGPLLEVEMSKKHTPLWREAHFQVKMHKIDKVQVRSTFRSCPVEKVHAIVARSTCRSQNVQNTPGSDMFGPLLDVQMPFRVTPCHVLFLGYRKRMKAVLCTKVDAENHHV